MDKSLFGSCFRRHFGIAVLIVAAFLLAGCAAPSRLMVAVPEGEPLPKPEIGKSMIVFIRPSGIGFALEAKITDITSEERMRLVGILGSKTKVPYQAEPGETFFMVTGGENTAVMKANLEPDRTYYCLVSVGIGFFAGRFSMEPIRSGETGSEKFGGWLRETTTMRNGDASLAWFNEKAEDLRKKRDKHLPKWEEMSEEERKSHTLFAEDGVL